MEKMLLMLNDKLDRLHDRVDELYARMDSASHTIPWAQTTGNEIFTYLNCLPHPPEDILEWTRRGWDVWKVTLRDNPPSYEITRRLNRALIQPSFDCFSRKSELLTS